MSGPFYDCMKLSFWFAFHAYILSTFLQLPTHESEEECEALLLKLKLGRGVEWNYHYIVCGHDRRGKSTVGYF